MATHYITLDWKIPWAEEPGSLQSMGSQRVGHVSATSLSPFPLLYTSLSAAAAAKSLQSCPTQCDPMDCSLPGFSVHGILQTRTLEWVAISFSNA